MEDKIPRTYPLQGAVALLRRLNPLAAGRWLARNWRDGVVVIGGWAAVSAAALGTVAAVFLAAAAVSAYAIAVYGYTVMALWAWFGTPLTHVVITLRTAMGFCVILSVLQAGVISSLAVCAKEEIKGSKWLYALRLAFVQPLATSALAYGLGYAIRFFWL